MSFRIKAVGAELCPHCSEKTYEVNDYNRHFDMCKNCGIGDFHLDGHVGTCDTPNNGYEDSGYFHHENQHRGFGDYVLEEKDEPVEVGAPTEILNSSDYAGLKINNGVTTEDLLWGEPHPNMRMNDDNMSDEAKLQHYREEHGYEAHDESTLKKFEKMHKDYHANDPSLKDNEHDIFRSQQEWTRKDNGIGPDPTIAWPHEHYNDNKTKDSIEKTDDLISSVDDFNNWFKDRPNRNQNRTASSTDFYPSGLPRRIAAQPPDFEKGKEYPPGLPRPQWRTKEKYHSLPGGTLNHSPEAEEKRYLYKKIPVPHNTTTISFNDIPEFNKDIIKPLDFSPANIYEDGYLEKDFPEEGKQKAVKKFINMNKNDPEIFHRSESLINKACPMCGGKFKDDDPAIIRNHSAIEDVLSDWLPYHEHCMKLVHTHCPHIRRDDLDDADTFTRGTYKDVLHQGILNFMRTTSYYA